MTDPQTKKPLTKAEAIAKFNHAFSMCGRALPYADEEQAKAAAGAFLRCPDCGATYPDYYDECPHCGASQG